LLGLAESTVKRILKQMVDGGKLEISGSRKDRRYLAKTKDNGE
jgi:DNA-binding MarR family transcriptional regulator